MDTSSPPITAIASGCSICEPEPSAKASGNMPQIAAIAVITMGRSRRCAACSIASRGAVPSARYFSSASSSRMPFFATMPMIMISPMNDATLKSVPVISSAKTTPEMESTDEVRIAIGAAKLRNSASSTPKTSASASSSTRSSSWKDCCCS